jgi:hypothetical protein
MDRVPVDAFRICDPFRICSGWAGSNLGEPEILLPETEPEVPGLDMIRGGITRSAEELPGRLNIRGGMRSDPAVVGREVVPGGLMGMMRGDESRDPTDPA